MKKNIFLTVSILLMSAVLLSACGGGSKETSDSPDNKDKVYEINFNVSAAPTSAYTTDVAEPWAKMVEEKTDGRVKVNVFPSASLGSFDTALEDIQNGVYELGLVSPGEQIDTVLFPLTIVDIPFTLTSPEVGSEVLTKFVDEYMGETDSFGNATFLSVYSSDPVNLYSKNSVEKVKDLVGNNLSDYSSTRLNLIKGWGSTPVQLTNTELYESLEKGVVDNVIYTTVGASGYSLHEVAPYLTKLDIGVIGLELLINTDFFNSLPDDLQTMFKEEFAPEYTKMVVETYSSLTDQAIKDFEDAGGNVINPSEAAMKEFKAPVADIAKEWVKEANKRGYDGEAMLESYKTFLEESGVESPF